MSKIGIKSITASLMALALVIAASDVAKAGTITEAFSFSATSFGANLPYDPVAGNFTLTFDPGVNSSGSLPSFSSNLPAYFDSWRYNAHAASAQSQPGAATPTPAYLEVSSGYTDATGHLFETATTMSDLFFEVVPSGKPLDGSGQFMRGYPYAYGLFYNSVAVTATDMTLPIATTTAIPEPTTFAMLSVGVLGLAIARQRVTARRC